MKIFEGLFLLYGVYEFLLPSLKTLTDSEYCSESCITISVPAFRVSDWSIFSSVLVMAGFRNSFQDHRPLSEQLLESQAAIGKPEQTS
jgi:hypothetical protein